MIEVSTNNTPTLSTTGHGRTQYIIAKPNQSASWQFNKYLIIALSLPSVLFATAFGLAAGAWPLLPFAGLEITGLGAALYIVCRRLQKKHVLKFNGHELKVEKGRGKPEHSWVFNISTLSIGVERQAHPWDPLKISLYGYTPQGQYQHVCVGDFLNKQDSRQLLAALRQQGLPVRNDSPVGEINV